jgi:hypothetical protein
MLEILRITYQTYELTKARTEAKNVAESLAYRAARRAGGTHKPASTTPNQDRQETKRFLAEALAMHCATSKMDKALSAAEKSSGSRKKPKQDPPTGAARTALALKKKQAATAKKLLQTQAAASEAKLAPAEAKLAPAEAKPAKVLSRARLTAAATKKKKTQAPTQRITRTRGAKKPAPKAARGESESEESKHSSADELSVEDQPYDPSHSAEDDPTSEESQSATDPDNAPLVAAEDLNFSLEDCAKPGVVWVWGVAGASGAVTPTMAVVMKVQRGRGGKITCLRCQYLTPALVGVFVGQWKLCVDARTHKPFMCTIVAKPGSEHDDVVPVAAVHCSVEWQFLGDGVEEWHQKCKMSAEEWAQLCNLLKQD